MARRGHSEEEILRVLREAESGETVAESAVRHGISQQSIYPWEILAKSCKASAAAGAGGRSASDESAPRGEADPGGASP